MSFAGAWGPPNLGDGVSGRQDGGQIEDSRRAKLNFGPNPNAEFRCRKQD